MRGTHRSGRTLLGRVPISADIPQETRLAWSSSLTQHEARLQLHRKSHQRVCLVATSSVWPATGVTEIAVPSAPGMWWTSPPELPADSADAVLPPSSLLKAPGKPQTAYTSQGNEINQTKRQFGLINRVSFYTCRLVTSKHYDNHLPAERQKKLAIRVFFRHSKLAGAAQPLRGLWHATRLMKARDAALRCSGVVKGTIWSHFAVFFPVSQPQAYEKRVFCQFSLPVRTGGCTASSKQCKTPRSRGSTKGINTIMWGQTQGQKQPRWMVLSSAQYSSRASLLEVQMKANPNMGNAFQWDASCSVGRAASLSSVIDCNSIYRFVSTKWT